MMSDVKLIGVTSPRIAGLYGPEDLVAYAARVSNPANQNNTETAPKLLEYLVNNKHWSPFEMVSVLMEITTTRDIARQILRHRSFSFQEFSQRYADPTEELDFQNREARLQDKKNRQNSISIDDNELQNDWINIQNNIIEYAQEAYDWAITQGIAKEQARAVLPEGLTTSRLYMNGTLRSWIHYVQVRADASTQKEHREIAQKCKSVLMIEFPSLTNIFNNETTQ